MRLTSRVLMLQTGLLGLLVGQVAQRFPLLGTDLADADPRLAQHLHLLKGTSGLA